MSALKSKASAIDIISEITTFHSAMLEKFTEVWKRAKANIGLYGINHWTDEQKKKFNAQERVPINLPVLTQKINSLLGFERENRTEAHYIGIGKEDELNGEILTKLRKWTDNNCTPKYKYIKSDIFRDAVVPCYGVLEFYVEEDVVGKPIVKMRRLPYNSVLWDWNFTDFEMDTCPRMQKIRWVYTDELKRDYPDLEDNIAKSVETIATDTSMYEHLKEFEQFYQSVEDAQGNKRYLCKEITDYNKKNFVCYDVIKLNLDIPDEIAEDKASFYTRKEAVEKIKEYEEKVRQLGFTGSMDELFKIKTTTKVRVQKTVITGNVVLQEPEWMDDDEFPIKVLFSYFYDGDFWTPTDVGRDAQNYFDKTFAQIDKSIGEGVKNGRIIYPNFLHPSMTPQQADERLTKGLSIYGKDPQNKPFELISAPPFQAQYLQVSQIIQSILEDAYGGRNFQGLTENAGQSGIAISNLQQAGAQMTLNFLENLQRFDEMVARYLMKKMIQLYDYEMEIRILGSDFTEKVMQTLQNNPELYKQSSLQNGVGFMRINAKGQKPIYESSYDIEVQPISSRRDEKDIKFNKLMNYAQITGNPIPPKMVGQMLDMTPTEIDELVAYAEQLQKQQMAEKQFQAKMEVAKASEPNAKDLEILNNMEQGSQPQAPPPPMVNINSQNQ